MIPGWWPGSRSPGQACSNVSTDTAHAEMTCSQLSSTSSRWRSATCPASTSSGSARRLLAQPEGGRDQVREQLRLFLRPGRRFRLAQRGEVDEPHPVRKGAQQIRGHPLRQPGLATPPTPVRVTSRDAESAA